MDQEKEKKKRLRKIVSEFDTKFGFMSQLDQKVFSESWLERKIDNDGTESI